MKKADQTIVNRQWRYLINYEFLLFTVSRRWRCKAKSDPLQFFVLFFILSSSLHSSLSLSASRSLCLIALFHSPSHECEKVKVRASPLPPNQFLPYLPSFYTHMLSISPPITINQFTTISYNTHVVQTFANFQRFRVLSQQRTYKCLRIHATLEFPEAIERKKITSKKKKSSRAYLFSRGDKFLQVPSSRRDTSFLQLFRHLCINANDKP